MFKSFLGHVSLQKIPYFLGALVIGIVSTGYAHFFSKAEGLAKEIFHHSPLLMLIVTPLSFLLSWSIIYFISPYSGGSGIPQVIVAIELSESQREVWSKKLLGLKVAFFKIFSSLICVAGGGASGREGPTIHIAACLSYFIGKRFQKIWPKLVHETWAIVGGAAGISAAFSTPLAGLVFAIEELSNQHFTSFRTALILAVLISGLAAQWMAGPYLYLGIPKVENFYFSFLLETVVIAILCGLVGGAFAKIVAWGTLRKRQIKNPMVLGGIALGCGFLVALMAILIDQRAFGPGRDILHELLYDKDSVLSWHLQVVRFLSPILTYLSGGGGGVFAPALALGGCIGASINQIFENPAHNLSVLIGMIALLTGVTRAPLTSLVIVLEMTDHHSAILPMMVSAFLSYVVAKLVDPKSLYEHLKEQFTPPPS
jgi:H+/Cl- antiporter ClcA